MLALGGYSEQIGDGPGLAERWVGSIAAGPIVAVQEPTPVAEVEAGEEVVGIETGAVGRIAGEGTAAAAAGTVEMDIVVVVAEGGIRLRANSQTSSSRKRDGLPIQWDLIPFLSLIPHPTPLLAPDITYHYNPNSPGLP